MALVALVRAGSLFLADLVSWVLLSVSCAHTISNITTQISIRFLVYAATISRERTRRDSRATSQTRNFRMFIIIRRTDIRGIRVRATVIFMSLAVDERGEINLAPSFRYRN